MKKSARAMRMERHHRRMAKDSKLSLVSLMDIFTILVFFLMLNASDVQVLQNSKSVVLPESTAKQAAKETLVLMVNNNELLLQGRKLATVASIMARNEELIPELVAELAYQSGKATVTTLSGSANSEDEPADKAITIMGDKDIPYALLKRIMQTCAQAGFTNISLAVESIESKTTSDAEVAG
ncbi:ExbD/TolR family protein [Paraglaciecola hydrolytica]|uniref:RNA polymerase subunit sigma-70 n=1 Tax=Paraglaciecola hydrolytica TaxID=1799789 RepID=A0A136A1S6_9ALTE|nr:biopolymer transporter ExbD [Paraglaciecola hydrolytica]KXI29153.1 RNA polymerase subunit sigma-70 [Paraglaciecola hydrolytica]